MAGVSPVETPGSEANDAVCTAALRSLTAPRASQEVNSGGAEERHAGGTHSVSATSPCAVGPEEAASDSKPLNASSSVCGRKPSQRRRLVTVAVTVLGAVVLAVVWWALVWVAHHRRPSAAPAHRDVSSGQRPIMEHGRSGVAARQYIIAIDEDAGPDALQKVMDFLAGHGVKNRAVPLLNALVATLTDDLIRELSSGRWPAVLSLERNARLSMNMSDNWLNDLGVGDGSQDDEVDGTPQRRLRGGRSSRRLQSSPEYCTVFEATSITAAEDTDFVPWHLDYLDELPRDGRYSREFEGSGVDIYIVDSGVRRSHLEFTDRVAPHRFGRGIDENGHGTAMAGAALGALFGAASGARVVDVQVLDACGSGTVLDLVDGLDWIASNRVPGRHSVVSMSLGGSRSPTIDNAVQDLVELGIPVVVAAGNEADDACDYSPAAVRKALTVGSVSRQGAVSRFSNTGSCVDIWAPGEEIVSASFLSDTGLASGSGTSPATAVTAGVSALFLEAGVDKADLQTYMLKAANQFDTELPLVKVPSTLPEFPSTTTKISSAPTTAALTTAAPTTASTISTTSAFSTTTTTTTTTTTGGATAAATTRTATPTTTTTATTTTTTTATTTTTTTTTTSTTTTTAAPTEDSATVVGLVSCGQEEMLVGQMLDAVFWDKVEATLECDCVTSGCNIDLYMLQWSQWLGIWFPVALSRSRTSDESLRIRVWSWSGTFAAVAFSRRGDALCRLKSNVA